MARKQKKPVTAHERVDRVENTIADMRKWWGKELTELRSNLNHVMSQCNGHVNVIRDLDRRITQEHSANTGLRSDFETFAAGFDVKKTVECPDLRGFLVPNHMTQAFKLRHDDTVSSGSLLDFVKVYKDDQTATGKAIFAMAHELLSLRFR